MGHVMNDTPTSELDKQILAQTRADWQKLAKVVALVSNERGTSTDEAYQEVADRIRRLVDVGLIDARGDLAEWRRSEVRLRVRNASDLNDFQRSTLDRLQPVLLEHGPVPAVEIRRGPEESDAVVKWRRLEFWIYPDGANVHGDGVDERLEICDFDSLDALQDAYITLAENLVRR
jgi:hypothetical protein